MSEKGNPPNSQPRDVRPERKSQWDKEFSLKEQELELKRGEYKRGRWTNPLAVAIWGVIGAAILNAAAIFYNGTQLRELEAARAENQRILNVLATGDLATATNNLEMLAEVGLIRDLVVEGKIRAYVKKARETGQGAFLPKYTNVGSWGTSYPIYDPGYTEPIYADERASGKGENPKPERRSGDATHQVKPFPGASR